MRFKQTYLEDDIPQTEPIPLYLLEDNQMSTKMSGRKRSASGTTKDAVKAYVGGARSSLRRAHSQHALLDCVRQSSKRLLSWQKRE